MAAAEQVGLADIQETTRVVLEGIQSDPRLGRSRRHPDIHFGFDLERAADFCPPEEGEDHTGRSVSEVTVKIGDGSERPLASSTSSTIINPPPPCCSWLLLVV